MSAVAILSGWWKALAGFLLAVLGFLALRRRKAPVAPPGQPGATAEAVAGHDARVQEADATLVDELLKPGDDRYEAAAAYLRNKKKANP